MVVFELVGETNEKQSRTRFGGPNPTLRLTDVGEHQ